MTRILVSVRDEHEASLAAGAGADFIDLKEPSAGALGGLPLHRIEEIVRYLRSTHPKLPVSATIGDWPADRPDAILTRVRQVAASGVDYVKVGIVRHATAVALIDALAHCDAAIVPVLIADDGIDAALVAATLAAKAFPAVMLDTAAKRGGSLLQRIDEPSLSRFVMEVQATARMAGLAGALREDDLAVIARLGPDFAGFRSAVCDGDRSGPLQPARVERLRTRLATGSRDMAGAAH
ncbi:MAG TPA: (5-formylfuran-3-yl)methyl phosphate synthase [Burkholderiaceae bacterium]|nr:(5-formylfuran-3-yl)methyl phosphate synthase [Burkholderiaceae bacterium]